MPLPHVHPLTDWLAALGQLEPSDDATREAIAALVRGDVTGPPAADTGRPETALPPRTEAPVAREQRQFESIPPATSSNSPTPRIDEALPFTFSTARSKTRAQREPRWLVEAASTLPGPIGSPPKLQTLLDPTRARSIVGATVAMPRPGEMDLDALITMRAARRPMRRIPRTIEWTVERGVQVLIDRSTAMQPFAADVDPLIAVLRDTVGREAVSILSFVSNPMFGCGRGPQRTWKPYDLDHAPPAGTCVLVASDLGLGGRDGLGGPPLSPDERWSTPEQWIEFAVRVAALGCGLAALVPVPPRRWPAPLCKALPMVEWDRGATARAAAIATRRLWRMR